MVHDAVEEVAVVAHDNQGAAVLLEVFFKYVEGYDVQVVGGLVEYEKIRVLHQDGEQVEPALLSSGEP